MIVQIRGTSGAGKSTVMKSVMEKLGEFEPRYFKGRKNPVWYLRPSLEGTRPIVVLSHYESPCAGCDVLGSSRIVYEILEMLDLRKYDILCEGLMLSEDVKWTSKLTETITHLYYLTTDIEVCIDRIKKRREEKGNDKPLDEGNTRRRFGVIERTRTKFEFTPVHCYRVSQNQATKKIVRRLLGNHNV